jgi:hypothetical protein
MMTATRWRVSYLQDERVLVKGETMTNYGRRAAGTLLTGEQLAELMALAMEPDSEIDFSDIPERVSDPSMHKPMPLELDEARRPALCSHA